MALTRSQARKLSQELDLAPCSKTPPAKAAELRDLGCESTAPRPEDSRVGLLEPPVAEAGSAVSVCGETEVAPLGETGTTLSPVAENWCELSKVDRETLIREQREDLSIKALMESVKLGLQIPQGHVHVSPIKEAWKSDREAITLKVMPHITQAHVEPDAFEKMRVNLAYQLFSEEVLKGLSFYKRDLQEKFRIVEPAKHFVRLMEKLIFMMSSRTPLKGLRPDSKSAEFLEEFIIF
ncbi:hypothetical protein MTO96_031812 [Rhipicephalus appendiculatus]